jgi:hypothetical protein
MLVYGPGGQRWVTRDVVRDGGVRAHSACHEGKYLNVKVEPAASIIELHVLPFVEDTPGFAAFDSQFEDSFFARCRYLCLHEY